jgi:hypothetical protein
VDNEKKNSEDERADACDCFNQEIKPEHGFNTETECEKHEDSANEFHTRTCSSAFRPIAASTTSKVSCGGRPMRFSTTFFVTIDRKKNSI